MGGDINSGASGLNAFDATTASPLAGMRRSFQDRREGPTPTALAQLLFEGAQASQPVNTLLYENLPAGVQALTVRPIGTLSDAHSDLLLQALQVINEALPEDFQLAYDPTPVPFNANANILLPSAEQNRILVRFAPPSQWLTPGGNPGAAAGLALVRRASPSSGQIASSLVQMPDTAGEGSARRTEEDLDTLIHELMHTLGRRHPPNENVLTVLRQAADGKPGPILFPLDTDALHAVYEAGRLTRDQAYTQSSEILTDLGAWSDTSTQFLGRFTPRGSSDTLDFGAQLRNGQVRAFAQGPVPGTDYALGANNRLGARYSGILAGFLHSGRPLEGTVSLNVQALPASGSLFGDLGFRALQSYGTGSLTGSPTPYAGGSLDYQVQVLRNTFHEVTRPDARDRVDGAFFGTEHSAMGGVLQRQDATAGFGGVRN